MSKRTIENCTVAKRYERKGLGRPEIERWENGEIRCLGYQKSDMDDEPIDVCLVCPLNTTYNTKAEFWTREAGRMGV